MKHLLRLLLISLMCNSHCFAGDVDVEELVAGLHNALINKDTVALKGLLHQGVLYGHSNGWTESRQEMIDDLFNGLLTYQSINKADRRPESATPEATPTSQQRSNTAHGVEVFKADYQYAVVYKNQPISLTLSVLFVWVNEAGTWKLLARQSTKI
jgi:hypothetical protein